MGIAERFFDAFSVRDYHTMGRMYAPTATFSDPAFPMLSGPEAALMWEMLLMRAQDFSLSYNVTYESDERAQAIWVAHYTFTQTGREVVNRIQTNMVFQAGRIIRHVDHFNFWKWSRQALGMPGLLLGWTPIVKRQVQRQAQESLIRFAAKKAAGERTTTGIQRSTGARTR